MSVKLSGPGRAIGSMVPLFVGSKEMAKVVSKPMSRGAASNKAVALTYETNVVHTTQWNTSGKWVVLERVGMRFGCTCVGFCHCGGPGSRTV